MRKTAGILKFCCTLALVLEVLAAIFVAVGLIALAMAGSFSSLAAKTDSPITITGGTLTPEEMDALKPFVMIALASAVLGLLFTIIGTMKTRTALGECKQERPFSEKCVKAIKASARMEIIGGLAGIASSVILMLLASSLTVNGISAGKSSGSMSLTFLFYAVLKYLLYHIANYGHTLETDPNRQ